MKNPFLILKMSDLRDYCREVDLAAILTISKRVMEGRKKDGLEVSKNYIVFSADEPYADEVIELINSYGQDPREDDHDNN